MPLLLHDCCLSVHVCACVHACMLSSYEVAAEFQQHCLNLDIYFQGCFLNGFHTCHKC